jgi:hypothetical protein
MGDAIERERKVLGPCWRRSSFSNIVVSGFPQKLGRKVLK